METLQLFRGDSAIVRYVLYTHSLRSDANKRDSGKKRRDTG